MSIRKISLCIATVALYLVCVCNAFAGQGMGPGPGVKAYAVGGGPSVSFYFNANSVTSGQAPTIGTGTVAIGSGTTANTGSVGNALTTNGGWSSGQFYFPVSGNLNPQVGTLGLYLKLGTDVNALIDFDGNYLTFPKFNVVRISTDLEWNYASAMLIIPSITTGTTYFIEFSWDYANSLMAYRVNGGTWTEGTVTGSAPTGEDLVFGSYDGNSRSHTFDQIIISPQYKADIYGVRNATSF